MTMTLTQGVDVAVKSVDNNLVQKRAIERLSHGVTIAGIPTITSIDLKRRWMLEHLAGAFRVFARKGYNEGMAGHISLRDPGELSFGI